MCRSLYLRLVVTPNPSEGRRVVNLGAESMHLGTRRRQQKSPRTSDSSSCLIHLNTSVDPRLWEICKIEQNQGTIRKCCLILLVGCGRVCWECYTIQCCVIADCHFCVYRSIQTDCKISRMSFNSAIDPLGSLANLSQSSFGLIRCYFQAKALTRFVFVNKHLSRTSPGHPTCGKNGKFPKEGDWQDQRYNCRDDDHLTPPVPESCI